jgi:hypothetical protein
MKEYVLDYPPPAAADPLAQRVGEAFVPPRARTPWRSLALLFVLESLALALLYVFLIGWPTSSPAIAESTSVAESTPVAGAPLASFTQAVPEPQPPTEVVALEPELPPSSITREHGRYVIELHSAAVGPALAMLVRATGATVRGEDVLAGNSARITTTVKADSPLEAWQAVFGGVVNFAASCTRATCAVRFVPSANPSLATAASRLPPDAAGAVAPAPYQPDNQGNAVAPAATSVAVARPPPAITPQPEDPSALDN